MVRKNNSSRRPMNEENISGEETESASTKNDDATSSASEPEESVPAEVTTAKSKAKASEDPSANSNVGIGDIRKAVAFVNSVGGMEKAMNLLQILKVAKEVQ